LKRLVIARSIEALRQYRRDRGHRVSLRHAAEIDGKALPPLEAAAANELVGELRAALTELEPRQAEVVCLVCLEGLIYRQVADQLAIPVSTVGVLLNRARASLRDRLRHFRLGPTEKQSKQGTQS